MSVTPKVYQFAPGSKTPAAIVDGVKRVMDSTLGTHHWETHAYVAGSTITVKDKLTGLRRLRLVSATTGTPSPTVDCYYSHDGGVTESNKCWMSGGTTTYDIDNGTWGMSIDEAYVVELEDAITIATAKGLRVAPETNPGPTGLVANAIGMSVHAGRILSAHNKSDSANRIGEEGLMCGQLMIFTTSTWSMLSGATAGGGGVGGGAQNAIWTGAQYLPVSIAQIPFSATATGQTLTHWRDSRITTANALTINAIENVGDNQSIERLVPFPIAGATSGTGAFGHTSYTRYIRARKYGHGDTPPASPPIDNTTVLQSTGDPNIGWRHNYGLNNTATVINLIHIWCPPGQEIVVP